ncbi:MAG: 5,6-dimethylbenzimidazole synthase [Pseudomonadota bacterium]
MEFSATFQQELDELFHWRRDVRRFQTRPLPDGLLSELLEATGSAPSVGLSEPWRFVEIVDAERRSRVVESFERCNAAALEAQDPADADLYARLKLEGLREAPTHLAVFCDEADQKSRGLGQSVMPEMRRYSVVCAVMQLWLAARARGVGMGWVSILEPEVVRAAASARKDWVLVAYLCLGWPEEEHLDCELERAGWAEREKVAKRVSRV